MGEKIETYKKNPVLETKYLVKYSGLRQRDIDNEKLTIYIVSDTKMKQQSRGKDKDY